uniref:proline-rich protein 36-like n=1 Tax=Halichoerus grypus TaxID=9711 RepID=UPI001658FA97|nr:proline-rich protein 36-like [Halichoerus grypus]
MLLSFFTFIYPNPTGDVDGDGGRAPATASASARARLPVRAPVPVRARLPVRAPVPVCARARSGRGRAPLPASFLPLLPRIPPPPPLALPPLRTPCVAQPPLTTHLALLSLVFALSPLHPSSSTSLSPPLPTPGSSSLPHTRPFSASPRLCPSLSHRPARSLSTLLSAFFSFSLFPVCSSPFPRFPSFCLLSPPLPRSALAFASRPPASSPLLASPSLPFLPLSPPAVSAFLPRLSQLLRAAPPLRTLPFSPDRLLPLPSIFRLCPFLSLPPSPSPSLALPATVSFPLPSPPPSLRVPPSPSSHSSSFPPLLIPCFPLHFLFQSFLLAPLLLVSIPSLSSPFPISLPFSFLSSLNLSPLLSLLWDFSPPLASFPLHLVSQCPCVREAPPLSASRILSRSSEILSFASPSFPLPP